MESAIPLLLFELGNQRYALRLAAVERVEHMVTVTPLPKAPDVIVGIINVQGRPIPVIGTRRRFRLDERAATLTDRLIIIRTDKRTVALAVDAVADVVSYPAEDVTVSASVVPGLEYVDGIVRLRDGLVLISDPDAFLSLEEERSLDASLSEI